MMTEVIAHVDPDLSLEAPENVMPHIRSDVSVGQVISLPFAYTAYEGELKFATYNGTPPEFVGAVSGPHGPYHNTYWTADVRIAGPCVIRDTHGHFWVCTLPKPTKPLTDRKPDDLHVSSWLDLWPHMEPY